MKDMRIEEKDGDLYITIPVNQEVEYREVTRFAKSLNARDIDYSSLKEAYTSSRGKSVRIGTRAGDGSPMRDSARITVEIEDGGRAAFVTLHPDHAGPALTYREIVDALKSNGVLRGLQAPNIKAALEGPAGQKFKAAEWIPPVDGLDAELTCHFAEYQDLLSFLLGKGPDVPFEEINFMQRVQKGDLVLSKSPPVKGVPGCLVTGEKVLPREGRDIPLERSEHLDISKDGSRALAARDGQVVIEQDGTVTIRPILVLKSASCDKEIRFRGSVLIEGDLGHCPGITASGDVEVWGGNQNVPIRADNVLIKGPFLLYGEDRGRIARDVACSTANGAHIAARNIYIGKSAGQCVLEAEEAVYSNVKEGKIIGGEILAGKKVVVGELGNPRETETVVKVATAEIQRRLNNERREQTEKKIKKLQEKMNSAQESYLALDQRRGEFDGKDMPRELKGAIKTAKNLREALQEEMDALKVELVRCKSFKPDASLGEVSCQAVYAGVRLEMGESLRQIRAPIESPVRFLKRAVGIVTEMKDLLAKGGEKEAVKIEAGDGHPLPGGKPRGLGNSEFNSQ